MDDIHQQAAKLRWMVIQATEQQLTMPPQQPHRGAEEEEPQEKEKLMRLATTLPSSEESSVLKEELQRRAVTEVRNETLLLENAELRTKLEHKQQVCLAQPPRICRSFLTIDIQQLFAKGSQLSTSQEEVKRLQGELSAYKLSNEKVLQHGKMGDYYLSTLKGDVAIAKQQVQGVEEAFAAVKEDLNRLAEVHTSCLQEILVVQHERQVLKLSNENYSRVLKDMEARMIAEEHEKLTLTAAEMILTQRLADQEEQAARVAAEAQVMFEQSSANHKQVSELRELLTEHGRQFKESQEVLRKTQQQYESAVAMAEERIRAKDAELAAMHERMVAAMQQQSLIEEHKAQPPVAPDAQANYQYHQQPSAATSAHYPRASEPSSAPVERVRPAMSNKPSVYTATTHAKGSAVGRPAATSESCGVCGDSAFGMMVICSRCSGEFHSACSKKSGSKDGKMLNKFKRPR